MQTQSRQMYRRQAREIASVKFAIGFDNIFLLVQNKVAPILLTNHSV